MTIFKQIEEMACEKCLHFEACRIAFKNSKALGIYDCTEEEYFNTTYDCDYYIRKDIYRKASTVAREIFEEIEEGVKAAVSALQFNNNPIHRNAKHEAYSSLMCFIKTIEEYTESSKEITEGGE